MNEPPESEHTWPWVRYFLQGYLPVHRGASANTVSSYRITFRQFRRYLYARIGERSARDLPLSALDPTLILDFLGWLQTKEGGGAKAMTTAWRRVVNDVPVLRGQIEEAIRIMLGVQATAETSVAPENLDPPREDGA